MKLSVLTWGLPCNWLKAISLYVMGNLGLRVYDVLDAVEQALLGELDSLSDSVDESPCDGGLSAAISSGVAGGVSTGQGPEGILSCCGLLLILGERLMVDRCQSSSLTVGAVLSIGVGLGGCVGLAM